MNIEALLEAERRGILPENKKALLAEARQRGLVPGGEGGPIPTPEVWQQLTPEGIAPTDLGPQEPSRVPSLESPVPSPIDMIMGMRGLPSPIDVASSEAERFLPQTGAQGGAFLGGEVGQRLGTMTGIPGAGYGGAVLGGGLGGGVGMLFDLVKHVAQNQAREITGGALRLMGAANPEPMAPALAQQPSVGQDIARIPQAVQQGAESMAYGIPAAGLVFSAMGPNARRMTPEQRDVNARMGQMGVPMSAGQRTGSPLLQSVEGGLTRMPGSSRYAVEYLRNQAQAVKEGMVNWLRDQAPGAAEDLLTGGEGAATTLATAEKTARAKASQQYNAIWKLTDGKLFPAAPLQASLQTITKPGPGLGNFQTPVAGKARSMLSEIVQTHTLPGSPLDQPGMPPLTGAELIKASQDYASMMKIPVSDAMVVLRVVTEPLADVRSLTQARSILTDIVRTSKRNPASSSFEARDAAIVAGGITKTIRDISQDPQYAHIGPLWTAANKNYYETVGVPFKDPDIIKSIWHKASQEQKEQILPLIFREGGSASVGPIKAMKKAVGADETRRWGATWMHDKLTREFSRGGEVSLERLASFLEPRNVSPEQLGEIFTPPHAADLETIHKGVSAIVKARRGGGNASETGRALITYHAVEQMGAIAAGTVAGIATGNPTVAAGTFGLATTSLLGVPWALSRILLSPTGARYLAEGFRPGLKPEQIIKLGTRLGTVVQYPSLAEGLEPDPEKGVSVELPQGYDFGAKAFK